MPSLSQCLVVLGTGGTIAGRSASAADNVGYRAGEVRVAELLAGLPVPPELDIEAEQVAQLDSKDMDAACWQALARRVDAHLQRPEVRGIVVTHGTDTLEETAWLLQRVLAPAKPVVLTAAMRPATSLQPDGPQNLADALALAALDGPRGVLVVLGGLVHGAAEVRKLHTYRIDAFGSGDAGPLARLAEGRLECWRPWPEGQALGLAAIAADPAAWPWVEIVTSHGGARGDAVDALVAAGVRGLLVAGTGNGTIHREMQSALERARSAGVVVRRASRCQTGPVMTSPASVVPPAGVEGAAKARLDLVLDLLAGRA